MNKELSPPSEWRHTVRPLAVLKAQVRASLIGLFRMERVVTLTTGTRLKGIGRFIPWVKVEYLLIQWERGEDIWRSSEPLAEAKIKAILEGWQTVQKYRK